MSAYSVALERTTNAVDQRARWFRRQVMTFVAIGIITVFALAVLRTLSVGVILLSFVPVTAFFLFLDAVVLNRWRQELLAAWVQRELEFAALAEAVRANRGLPTETVHGMLMTLPKAGDLGMELRVSTPTRQAVAAASRAAHHAESDVMLLNALACAAAVCVLILGVWMRSVLPLLGLTVIALLPLLRWWARRRRRLHCDAEVAVCRQQAGFSENDFLLIRGAAP